MDNTDTKSVEKRVPNSSLYRSKIKRMVEMAKALRGIPHGRKIPKGPAITLKNNPSDADRAAYAKVNNHRLTIDTVHFFADTIPLTSLARAKEQTPVEQALAEVAAEAKK